MQMISQSHSNKDIRQQAGPTQEKQRFVILDALRGFALFGIILANFPEFGLWTFLSPEAQANISHGSLDSMLHFLLYVFVDGKFYSIFSMLFGIGFSIILTHAMERGHQGIHLFYRRMIFLALIGLAHLLLLWSGDILLLYALMGMLLPLFWRCGNRQLLAMAALLLTIPVILDLFQEVSSTRFSAPIIAAWWTKAHSYGITEDNFAVWLKECTGYQGIHQFLMQGAIERMYEFVDGHRPFKVLGLFILGYWVGRNRLYARLQEYQQQLRKACWTGIGIGLPASLLYAYSATHGHPWGLTIHAFLYLLSAYPLALSYITVICLAYTSLSTRAESPHSFFRFFAFPGRMALSNYIGQSLAGIILFYGIGLALGATISLLQIECLALLVFIIEAILSRLWLSRFRYGLLEWLWRMLTYGQRLPLTKNQH